MKLDSLRCWRAQHALWRTSKGSKKYSFFAPRRSISVPLNVFKEPQTLPIESTPYSSLAGFPGERVEDVFESAHSLNYEAPDVCHTKAEPNKSGVQSPA